jgi:hypothetical protein
MTCILDHAIFDCLSTNTSHISMTLSQDDNKEHDDEVDQGVEIISATPQSPVSSMADLTILLVDKHNSYKEVIDNYYSPRQWKDDPYNRDRLRCQDGAAERLQKLSLESIFDKHQADEVDMEWSDDDDDEGDEPRGLNFLVDDCLSSPLSLVSGMDCSSIGWSTISLH